MPIKVLRDSKIPLYRQIAEQFRTLIKEGELPPESLLPSARLLATELDVSMFAVHRAYVVLAEMGLVESRQRVGTRVVAHPDVNARASAVARLPVAGPTTAFERLSRMAGIRSMASVSGDPELFQADRFIAELESLRSASPWTFDYSSPTGVPELLREIARLLTHRGLVTNESSLIVTSGCLGGLSTLIDVAMQPGDTILVQEPGPLWLRELVRIKGVRTMAIRSTPDGVDLDHAAELARAMRPRAFLVAPDFGYCTGTQMTMEQREALIGMARDEEFLLVEDGALTLLRYGCAHLPSLASLDSQNVAHIGSFSYSLCPGVGTGYVRLPPHLRGPYAATSETLGLHVPQVLQIAMARFLEAGGQEAHLRRALPKYEARRDRLMQVLAELMPPGVTWTDVRGGLATWVTLPRGLSSSLIYYEAIQRGLAFAPGVLFVTAGDPDAHLRLSFCHVEPPAIGESVGTLARLIERRPGRPAMIDGIHSRRAEVRGKL